MAQLQLQPPEPFDFRNSDDWPRWKRRFEHFRNASGLATSAELQQVSTLLYCIGEEAEAVLESTSITEDERKKYDDVLGKFEGYFKVRRNVIFERARFNRRCQQDGESAEKYITELYTLAENCNYGAMKDEMIRDRLVVGIRDSTLSQQLQLDADLTLEKAKTKTRQREAVGEQQKTLSATGTTSSTNLDQLHFRRRQFSGKRPAQRHGDLRGKTKDATQQKTCTRCGKGSHPREKCPAKDATCHRCSKKGHYGAQCLTKRKQIAEVEGDVDGAFLGEVGKKQTPAWYVTVGLNGHKTNFKLDTGAEVSAISEETHKTLRKAKISPPKKPLYGPSKQQLNCIGQFKGKIRYKGKYSSQTIFVIKGLNSNLLGLPAITALNLVARLDMAVTDITSDYRKQFPSLFRGLGNLGDPFEIHLKPDAVPHCLYTARHVPLPLRDKVKLELDQMESAGIIERVDGCTLVCWDGGSPKEGGKSKDMRRSQATELSGLDGVLCLMDDILVFAKDEVEHDRRLKEVLQRIQTAGVTLNPEKCEFRKRQLKFLGHIIDENGISPDPDKISAIVEMKPPTNVSELRRFMGMINQLGKFSHNLAELTQPLRQLLSKSSTWVWGPDQDKAFSQVKLELTQPTILTHYNPDAPTKISADASSFGLGAVLLQKSKLGWKPVVFASRSLTDTETRYAQIEKEALATVWACEKFSTYVLGMKFLIETDHKPLVPLLGSKRLDSLPPRILRFRLRLARFDYSIMHVPGKLLYTADTLSRAPSDSKGNDVELQQDVEIMTEIAVINLPITEDTLGQYQRAQSEDGFCKLVARHCKEGWPAQKNLDGRLIPYWMARGHLTMSPGGLLLYDSRIVVPDKLQKETLKKIHSGHQGIERCRLRAKVSVWWPGISKEIENMVKQCHTCARNLTPRKEPMIASELPQYPWQKVGADLFFLNGANYLLLVDYFSRYPEVQKLPNTTSTTIIASLKASFARFGIPEVFMSDNGPQFASELFANFTRDYGFTHVTSSPRYPQSNGQVERTVQTVKRLLEDSEDPYMAVLTYRTTPFPWCKKSPAELLMGRRLRDNISVLPTSLIPQWSYLDDFREKNKRFKELQKRNYDRQHGTRDLSLIPDDSEVWIRTEGQTTSGTVIRPGDAPRSYLVDTPTGQIRRNRQHLNVVPPPSETSTSPDQERNNSTSITGDHIVTRSRSGTQIHPPDRLY